MILHTPHSEDKKKKPMPGGKPGGGNVIVAERKANSLEGAVSGEIGLPVTHVTMLVGQGEEQVRKMKGGKSTKKGGGAQGEIGSYIKKMPPAQ